MTSVDDASDHGQVIVANQNSGSLSVIDAATDQVIITIGLPQGFGHDIPDPIYLVYLRITDEIIVGDRANSRLVFFDRSNDTVTALRSRGAGVFHRGANPDKEQLWTVKDIDNTAIALNRRSYDFCYTTNISRGGLKG